MCEDYVIRVPDKKRLHLKWCLLDDETKDLSRDLPGAKRGSQRVDPVLRDNGLLLNQLRVDKYKERQGRQEDPNKEIKTA